MPAHFSPQAYRTLAAVFLSLVFSSAIASDNPAIAFPSSGYSRPLTAKKVSFALLDDYDKGDNLADVAKDFVLMKELGMADSNSQARSLIEQGGVRLDGKPVAGDALELPVAELRARVLQVGRRRFVKLR